MLVVQGHAQGVQLLYDAFESDPSNPDLLALLSQHCLVNNCFEEVSLTTSIEYRDTVARCSLGKRQGL